MSEIVTPTQGRKDFFKIIRDVNLNNKPVIIKPTKSGERGAVVIGEEDFDKVWDEL